MKIGKLLGAFLLPITLGTACHQGGGFVASSNEGVACTESSVDDPYEVYGKVQITSGENQATLTSAYLSKNRTAIHTLLNDFDRTVVKSGTELVAVVKDNCSTPGLISRGIVQDGTTTPSGVRSYPYVLREHISGEDLRQLAEDDECLVGLSDAHRSYLSALPNDPMAAQQGHFKMLEASEAWPKMYADSSTPRRDVVIAIVDTGVDIRHKDLAPNLWVNTKEIPANGKDDDGNGYVDDINGFNIASKISSPLPQGSWSGNYHGTHVAGLAAARAGNNEGVAGVMGVAVKIMALNVFGVTDGAYNYDTENAIRYAADNGAHVINLSIGGIGGSASYEAAIAYAVKKGVTVLAAAGNEKRSIGSSYFMAPAMYAHKMSGMLAIGSVDSNSSLSVFSNYNPNYVELGAPGSEVSSSRVGLLSTMPNNKYGRLQGTSMATPVAAGAAGLAISMLEARGYLPSAGEVESVLENSGKVVQSLVTRFREGRVLNLKTLAQYITDKYPVKPVNSDVEKPGIGDGPPVNKTCLP